MRAAIENAAIASALAGHGSSQYRRWGRAKDIFATTAGIRLYTKFLFSPETDRMDSRYDGAAPVTLAVSTP